MKLQGLLRAMGVLPPEELEEERRLREELRQHREAALHEVERLRRERERLTGTGNIIEDMLQ